MVFALGTVYLSRKMISGSNFDSGLLPKFHVRRTNYCICSGCLLCDRVFCTQPHGLSHEFGRRPLPTRSTKMADSDGNDGSAANAVLLCTVLCVASILTRQRKRRALRGVLGAPRAARRPGSRGRHTRRAQPADSLSPLLNFIIITLISKGNHYHYLSSTVM